MRGCARCTTGSILEREARVCGVGSSSRCRLLLVLLAAVDHRAAAARRRRVAADRVEARMAGRAGAYHIHSARSDGTGTLDEIAAAAARAGLQFVILTDHGDGTRAPEPPSYRSGVLCIDGVEISTEHGHYVALGLPQTPYPLGGHPRDVIEDVAARSAASASPRIPGSPKAGACAGATGTRRFDGLEWLNADSEWRDEFWGSLGRVAAHLRLSAGRNAGQPARSPGAGARAVGPARARASRDRPRRRGRARAPRVPAGERAVSGSRARARAVVRRRRSARSRIMSSSTGRSPATRPSTRAHVLDAIREGRVFTSIDGLATLGRVRSEGAERDRLRAGGGVSRPARPGRDRCADCGARRHDAGRRPRWAGDLRRTDAKHPHRCRRGAGGVSHRGAPAGGKAGAVDPVDRHQSDLRRPSDRACRARVRPRRPPSSGRRFRRRDWRAEASAGSTSALASGALEDGTPALVVAVAAGGWRGSPTSLPRSGFRPTSASPSTTGCSFARAPTGPCASGRNSAPRVMRDGERWAKSFYVDGRAPQHRPEALRVPPARRRQRPSNRRSIASIRCCWSSTP